MTNSAMSPGHGRPTIDNTRSPDRCGAGRLSQTPTMPLHLFSHRPLGNFKPHPMATRDALGTLPKGAGELPLHTSAPPLT